MRDYPHPEDIGLDPEADRTEDLRPAKSDDPGVGAPRTSVEHLPTIKKEKFGCPR